MRGTMTTVSKDRANPLGLGQDRLPAFGSATMPGMATLLGTTGVACAAFCIWLVVRIVNRGQKLPRVLLAAMLLAVPLYPVSAPPLVEQDPLS